MATGTETNGKTRGILDNCRGFLVIQNLDILRRPDRLFVRQGSHDGDPIVRSEVRGIESIVSMQVLVKQLGPFFGTEAIPSSHHNQLKDPYDHG